VKHLRRTRTRKTRKSKVSKQASKQADMSYYNQGAPPVNVPPPQGYGEVFSMLIIITSFVFFVLILPSSLSLFV
jgi:hypothetical protein